MKKHISMLAALALAGALLASCTPKAGQQEAQSGGEPTLNQEFSMESMATVAGRQVSLTQEAENVLTCSRQFGYAALLPDSWKDLPDECLNVLQADSRCLIALYPEQVRQEMAELTADPNSAKLDEEDLAARYQQLMEQSLPFACLYAANDTQSAPEGYEKTDLLAQANGLSYYLAYNTALPDGEFTQDDQAVFQQLAGGLEELKQQLIVFPPLDEQSQFQGNLTQFQAQDMTGKDVDQSIFSGYELTMVNIWTTWCGVCVEELPVLEEVYQQLPDNVNLITICGDAGEEMELAGKILEESGATFQTLVANESLRSQCLDEVVGYPTTLFVDRDGRVVGDILIGALPQDDTVAACLDAIDARLALA